MRSSTLLLVLLCALSAQLSQSHAFLRVPASRSIIPGATYEPQSANRGGVCGTILSGAPNFNDPQWVSDGGSFVSGQPFLAEVVVTAHHMGHFEFRLCTDPSALSQSCFDQHVLSRTLNSPTRSPYDSAHPGRWYLPPGRSSYGAGTYTMEFKLPDQVSCDKCVLQWTYITGNSCVAAGYKSYFTANDAAGTTSLDWHMGWLGADNSGTCGGREASSDVSNIPEKFWGCADINIVGSDSTPSTVAPTPEVTPTAPSSSDCAAGCGSCISVNGNCANATDAHCAPCARGQSWWPCNREGLCRCAAASTTAPTQTVTAAPSTASPTMDITVSPTNAVTTLPPVSTGDSRQIAYLGNWQACPSTAQTAQYTHIVIAFAVSYTWSQTKNVCNQQCTISTNVPVCNNQPQPTLVAAWRAAGKKVILSFGGAGMGGSWSGDNNDCWDYCFGKEASVVTQLTTIVNNQNFDGVDIDYEYFYQDKPPNRPSWSKAAEALQFLRGVTTGLRVSLGAARIVTHAPMDSDLQQGKPYYELLKEVSGALDFLMPQYYNGVTRPGVDGIDGTGAGAVSALSNYKMLVEDLFGGGVGSNQKVVFGFCISDCSGTGSNVNAQQAASIMMELKKTYPCNGGAFFWVALHDTQGAWSSAVNAVLQPSAGCSGNSPSPPSDSTPTATPTSASTSQPDLGCASGCATCGRVVPNPQGATDEHCAPCANGQTWWPCATPGLCTCTQKASVQPLGA